MAVDAERGARGVVANWARSFPLGASKLDWQTVARLFACIILLTLPFAHTAAVRNASLAIACLATLLAWRHLKAPRIPLLPLFVAWGVLGLVSLTWAVDVAYSASELKTEALYSLLVFVLFFSLSDITWLVRFRYVILDATALSFAFALASVSVVWQQEAGLYNGPGMYSTYLVAVFPFVLVWLIAAPSAIGVRVANGAVLLVVLIGAALTLNRAVWIAFGLQTSLVLVLRQREGARRAVSRQRYALLAVVVSCVFLGSLYAISSKRFSINPASPELIQRTISEDVRLSVWRHALDRISERPFSGLGFGRGAARRDFVKTLDYSLLWHAHNVVLNYGLAMGIWGIALVLCLFGGVVWRLAALWKQGDPTMTPYALAGIAMVAGMFAKNMTDDLFVRQNALLYWALAGRILGAVRSAGPASVIRSILVIRRDNIGDLVCTLPLLKALRKRYPQAWIGLYANTYNAPILAGHPDIDEVFAYRKAKHHRDAGRLAILAERVSQTLALRRKRLDWVLLATPADQPRLRRYARLLAPNNIAGFVADPNATRGLTHAVPLDSVRGLHEVQAVFRLAGAVNIRGEPPAPQLMIDPAQRDRVQQALATAGLDNSPHPLIGIHVSARKPSQRWPAPRFVELMHALHAQARAAFILFWSPGPADQAEHPGDDDKARQIMAQLAGVPVLAWATATLPALVAGLSVCDSVICSDGGAMHVAAALDKRIVCLFGQSEVSRWRPWGVPHRVLQAPSHDVSDVSVKEVVEAWRELSGLPERNPSLASIAR